MNSIQSTIQRNASRVLVTSILTFAGIGAVMAGDDDGRKHDGKPGMSAQHGERQGHHGKGGMHRGGKHGPNMRKMMRGLDLTEAQKDKIFEIRHAAVPAMRDAHKAERAARKQLRDYSQKGVADQAQLQQYADSLGQAISAATVLRVQTMEQVLAQLTEEQAAKVRERMSKHGREGHGKRGHHKGERGMDGHGKGGHKHGGPDKDDEPAKSDS